MPADRMGLTYVMSCSSAKSGTKFTNPLEYRRLGRFYPLLRFTMLRKRVGHGCAGFEPLEGKDLLTTISLFPNQDVTLIEDEFGELASGSGEHLFVGRTAQPEGEGLRRALVSFDLSEIPDGSTIDSVSLSMTLSKSNPESPPMSTVTLHRVFAAWGEGASNASQDKGRGEDAETGDATWLHARFDGPSWREPGGDFRSGFSGTANIGRNGVYEWSTAQMRGDVEDWFEAPEENFGWILVGDESQEKTAKRFDSREHPTEANRPTLTIEFTEPPVTPTVKVSDQTVEEGNAGTTLVAVPVEISHPPENTATVSFALQADSAVSGDDFVANSGTLTFTSDGPLTQNVLVEAVADLVHENDESLRVLLDDAVELIIEDAEATVSLINDDPIPVVSIADVTVTEQVVETTAQIEVTLSNPSSFPISVEYSTTAGTATQVLDYAPASGQLSFAPGETSKSIDLAILADQEQEADETLSVILANVANAVLPADPSATVTIADVNQVDPPAGPAWQNAILAEDTTGDGRVVALDALVVINAINAQGLGELPSPTTEQQPPPYLDVTGDNRLSALDALRIINLINERLASGEPVPHS